MAAERKILTVSAFQFYRNARRILKDPLPFHHKNFERSGGSFRMKVGRGKPVIFSRDAAFASYVLQTNQKNYKKSPIQTTDMAKYLGRGLLTAEGEYWKQQRRLLQPAFHKKQLSRLLESIQVTIEGALDKIPAAETFDVFPVFNDLAFQTVVTSLFSNAASKEEMDRLQYITEAAQRMLVRELRQPYLSWWFHLSGEISRHLALTREAREIISRIIAERRRKADREGDLLDMLLDARYEDGEGMSNEQIIDEILILFTAGHETTSNALSFTAALLAAHPHYQDRMHQEAVEASKASTSPEGFIRECKLIQQVIYESLRLYPPAYFIDRMSIDKDEFDGISIPAGTSILFSIYEIHRHPGLWEEPEQFFPERFGLKDTTSHFFPFGAGPRKCIGSNFAMFEMILSIAELVTRYEIGPREQVIKTTPLITLKPRDILLNFKKRTQ